MADPEIKEIDSVWLYAQPLESQVTAEEYEEYVERKQHKDKVAKFLGQAKLAIACGTPLSVEFVQYSTRYVHHSDGNYGEYKPNEKAELKRWTEMVQPKRTESKEFSEPTLYVLRAGHYSHTRLHMDVESQIWRSHYTTHGFGVVTYTTEIIKIE